MDATRLANKGAQQKDESESETDEAQVPEVDPTEASEAADRYAAAADLAKSLLNNEQENKDNERDAMLQCIGGLLEGGVMLMAKLAKAKKDGNRAIIFGHLRQGLSVHSLKELTLKTGQSGGPLYEQVMRVFSTRKDVKTVEIWPSHIHGQR